MTSASSEALQAFWDAFTFNQLTVWALIALAVLAIAVIEQEVLRAVNPALRARSGRVISIVIYPLAMLAAVVIVARFIQLA